MRRTLFFTTVLVLSVGASASAASAATPDDVGFRADVALETGAACNIVVDAGIGTADGVVVLDGSVPDASADRQNSRRSCTAGGESQTAARRDSGGHRAACAVVTVA